MSGQYVIPGVGDLTDVSAASPSDGQALTWVGANNRWEPVTGGGGGQSNTASNVGVGGVGLFDAKVAVDLQFRNINAADGKITVALDAGNKEVDIGLGSVALDDLSNVVETVSALGDLLIFNGTNWINQSINDLTADATPNGATDYVMTWDNDVGTNKKVLINDLPGGGGGLANVVEDTTPQLGGMLDVNGNALGDGTLELLKFSETASAVNEITITNAATAGSPSITATGDDVDIDLTLDGKGSGTVKTLSSNLDITGNIIVSGTVDGRDVATDGTKLDGIETAADVTDAANVAAAGAIMDSDYSTNGVQIRTASGTYTSRTVTGTANEIDVADGDGVSANPTIGLSDDPIVPGTAKVRIPVGTTAQRPGTPADGDLRVNTTTGNAEIYRSAAWRNLEAGGSGALNDLTDVVIAGAVKGDIIVYNGTNWVDLAVGTNGHVLTADSAQTEGIKWAAGGGGGFQAEINISFASMSVNTTGNFAALTYVDLGTVEDLMAAFDDTTQEYRQGTFVVPSNIDTSGTVTLEIYGKRASGTAAANVAFDFDHRSVADSEAGDGSYTSVLGDDMAVDTTAGDLDRLTWTVSVSTLAWTADELIEFRIGRQAATTSNLSGDYYGWHFRILIPRA